MRVRRPSRLKETEIYKKNVYFFLYFSTLNLRNIWETRTVVDGANRVLEFGRNLHVDVLKKGTY